MAQNWKIFNQWKDGKTLLSFLMQTIITSASLDLYKEEAIGADVEKHINYFCVFFCNKNGHILLIFFGKYRRARQRWWIFWFSVPLVGWFQPFQGMSSWTMVKKMKMWKQHQQLANNSSMWPIWHGRNTTYTTLFWVIHADLATCFPPISGVFLQLEAGIVDITWSIGDPDCLKDPWMAMRNESYGHPHHGKQAATMTSCRHTRCKRLLPKKLNWAAAERNETCFWVKESIRWLFPELEVSSTLVRLEGYLQKCSTLWKQLCGRVFVGTPGREKVGLQLRKGRFSKIRGQLFAQWASTSKQSQDEHWWLGFSPCLFACLPLHSDSMVADFSHKSPLRTEKYTQLFMLILFLLHPASLRKGSVSMHPLIFPRVIEISINSHHQCGCATLYGSFPLIHINPASQSTYLMRSERQSLTKTGLLVSQLVGFSPFFAQPRPIRQWPPWLGLGDLKWNQVAKALFFTNVIVPTLKFPMLLLEDRIL